MSETLLLLTVLPLSGVETFVFRAGESSGVAAEYCDCEPGLLIGGESISDLLEEAKLRGESTSMTLRSAGDIFTPLVASAGRGTELVRRRIMSAESNGLAAVKAGEYSVTDSSSSFLAGRALAVSCE